MKSGPAAEAAGGTLKRALQASEDANGGDGLHGFRFAMNVGEAGCLHRIGKAAAGMVGVIFGGAFASRLDG